MARVRDVFGVDAPLHQLFADPTIARLAAAIEHGNQVSATLPMRPHQHSAKRHQYLLAELRKACPTRMCSRCSAAANQVLCDRREEDGRMKAVIAKRLRPASLLSDASCFAELLQRKRR